VRLGINFFSKVKVKPGEVKGEIRVTASKLSTPQRGGESGPIAAVVPKEEVI